jgi:uncharacterized protein
MAVVADTSFVVALVNQGDINHSKCFQVWQQQDIIFIPQTALTEIAYLIRRDYGEHIVTQFLAGLPKSKYRLIALDDLDVARTTELLIKYRGTRIDFVDVTIVAIAERLNISTILTLDKRDFSLIVPRHAEYLTLLPDE